jgi:hypothetical protein
VVLYGAETWTLWQFVDHKYLENFEMWYWRRMEIIWTNRVKITQSQEGEDYPTYNKKKEG